MTRIIEKSVVMFVRTGHWIAENYVIVMAKIGMYDGVRFRILAKESYGSCCVGKG